MEFAGVPIALIAVGLSMGCLHPQDSTKESDDTGPLLEDVPVRFEPFTTTATEYQGTLIYQLETHPTDPETQFCPWAYGAFMQTPAVLPWIELDTCLLSTNSGTSNLWGEVDLGPTIPLAVGGDLLTMTRETEFEKGQVIYWYDPPNADCSKGWELGAAIVLDGVESDVMIPDGTGGIDIAPQLMAAIDTGTLDLNWQPSERRDQQLRLQLIYFDNDDGYGVGVECALQDDGHAAITFGDGPLDWLHVMAHIGRRRYGSLTHPTLGEILVYSDWDTSYRSWEDKSWEGTQR